MKKKILSLLLIMVMCVYVTTGCGPKSETASNAVKGTEATAEEEKAVETETTEATVDKSDILVGFAISYTGNGFMQGLADLIKTGFEKEGYKCEVASADGNATTQIEQIENFVAMKAKLVVVMGVDPTGLADVTKRAREQGTEVIAFTTKIDGATMYVGSESEHNIGAAIAQLGSEWIDKTYPDAKDGEIETVIFGYSGNPEAADRSNGIKEAIEKNSKASVTYIEPKDNSVDSAQMAAENLFQTNPNTRVILCYNSGMSNGVNAYVMSQGSGVSDLTKFATFGSDISEEIIASIIASKTNESVIRGCVSLGDFAQIWDDIYSQSKLVLEGQEVPAEFLGKLQLVTADTLQ